MTAPRACVFVCVPVVVAIGAPPLLPVLRVLADERDGAEEEASTSIEGGSGSACTRRREKKLLKRSVLPPPTPSFVGSLGGFSWCIYRFFKRPNERGVVMRPKKSFPFVSRSRDGTRCVISKIR